MAKIKQTGKYGMIQSCGKILGGLSAEDAGSGMEYGIITTWLYVFTCMHAHNSEFLLGPCHTP